MDGVLSDRMAQAGLSVGGLVRQVRRRWLFLLGAAALGVLTALFLVRMTAPHYTAQMVVGPVGRSGPASMGSRVPALVAGAGRTIAEPGSGDEMLSDYTRFLRLLGSVAVAEQLADRPVVMQGVFHQSWNEERQAWEPPSSLTGRARRFVMWLSGRASWVPPDAQALAAHLRGALIVEPLGGGPMQRIAYRHPDRSVALAVVGGVRQAADAAIRSEASRRIRAEIEYVQSRLGEETQSEHRRALGALLAEQERARMMIDVGLPFAADMVEPVTAPLQPDWPDPLVLIPFGGVAGLMFGLFGIYAQAARAMARI